MSSRQIAVVIMTLFACSALSRPASGHCDTTKGPVVTAARAALEAGKPDLVLQWVRPEDESAVRSAFERTMKVRALGAEAKALADRYFFETLVRIHRAGEGAPYTGLTDAEPEPVIAATDRALERGSADELERMLVSTVKAGLAERFAKARDAKDYAPGDVAAGRAFVAAYVPLTHWVEGVFDAATSTGDHHAEGAGHAAAPHAAALHESNAREETAVSHRHDARRYVPWILAGFLAIAAFVEGVLLLRHRRHLAT